MTKVLIEGECTCEPMDSYGNAIIMRHEMEAQISITVEVNGKKQFRRTFRYRVTSVDNDICLLFNEVVNSRFAADMDFFSEGVSERMPEPSDNVIIEIQPNPFLEALFKYMKDLGKPALEYFN